ncbi:unnamed protein product [Rhodiola kirilowii]
MNEINQFPHLSSLIYPSQSDTNHLVRIRMRYQYFIDKLTPYVLRRWIAFAVIFCIYALRVFMIERFHIITYNLGLLALHLFIAFISPQVDPEMEGPGLPTKESDEFRPFMRRLPEFTFWYCLMMAFCIAFVLTFFDALDVNVFWPLMLIFWLMFFVSMMKTRIMHMVKYKYVPFSVGKPRYFKKEFSLQRKIDADSS